MKKTGSRPVIGVVLAMLTIAVLACGGGAGPTAAPQASDTAPVPNNTNAPATDLPAPTEAATDAPTEAPTDTAEPEPTALDIGASKVSDADGMTMLYVPAGEFLMGAGDDDTIANDDERPQHTVTLDAFWIDRTEVTNSMYAQCVAADGCAAPELIDSATRPDYYENANYANHPVMHVTWEEASAYCEWAGRRLPTEAEWEKAARGTDGRLYPWGDEEPSNTLANFNNADTTQAGSYSGGASPYGALDMAGSLYEWVQDWYGETYYAESPEVNPTGPESDVDERHVVRGGYWGTSEPYLRVTGRDGQSFNRPNWIGFRCAADEFDVEEAPAGT